MNAVSLDRGRPRSNALLPLSPSELKAGDILFKHASSSMISRAIQRGQGAHYEQAKKDLDKTPAENMPSESEATEITHVAVAAGPDDVLEFDEGGATKVQIAFGKGYGFVRGKMNLASRKGKIYEVWGCTHEELWTRVVDKATLIWDLTHTSNVGNQNQKVQDKTPFTASYGLNAMLKTAFDPKRKKEENQKQDVSLDFFEKTLNGWLKQGDAKGNQANSVNLQFFCSHFVIFCYLWAASELHLGEKEPCGLSYVLGGRTKVSPTELYTRIKSSGSGFFRYKGQLIVA